MRIYETIILRINFEIIINTTKIIFIYDLVEGYGVRQHNYNNITAFLIIIFQIRTTATFNKVILYNFTNK